MAYKTIKVCQMCGGAFYGGPGHFYYSACARVKKLDALIRTRICQECGNEFLSFPSAKRCPKCSVEAQRERQREYRKHGVSRPLGSTDKCIVCGKEYIVNAGSQKYCPGCRREASLKKQKERHRLKNDSAEQLLKQQERRRKSQKVCVYCMRIFKSSLSTNACSEYCREENKKLKLYQSKFNRGIKCNYEEFLNKREKYRKEVSLTYPVCDLEKLQI